MWAWTLSHWFCSNAAAKGWVRSWPSPYALIYLSFEPHTAERWSRMELTNNASSVVHGTRLTTLQCCSWRGIAPGGLTPLHARGLTTLHLAHLPKKSDINLCPFTTLPHLCSKRTCAISKELYPVATQSGPHGCLRNCEVGVMRN